jgi:hypothetical protein
MEPVWDPFTINYLRLCSKDPHKTIKFDFYDWNYSGNHVFIGLFNQFSNLGSVETNFQSLNKKSTYEIINAEKTKKSKRVSPYHLTLKYKNSGLLEVQIKPNYTFFDYLQSGLEISLIVALDFSKNRRIKKGNRFLSQRFDKSKSVVGKKTIPFDFKILINMKSV